MYKFPNVQVFMPFLVNYRAYVWRFCDFFVPLHSIMILHVFNPEHDIALAANLSNFTAPHAGRQLRADLGFLPALWAGDGDAILVDNVDCARHRYARLRNKVRGGQPLLVDKFQLSRLDIERVDPWGWDLALCAQLRRYGVVNLPDESYVTEVRTLSHRRTAVRLLPQLRQEGTVGESYECSNDVEVARLLDHYGQLVLKAPWSSSGRGLRFLSKDHTPLAMQAGWLRNVIAQQGSVIAEPYYQKVKDFGMEFTVDASHVVHYEGLSLFHTQNGAYVGNVIATEARKNEMITRYVPAVLLKSIQQKICRLLCLGSYVGPFGVDMMVVAANEGFLLHPCVEVNLRRTMGHVALTQAPDDDDVCKVMRIHLEDNYKLKIQKL